MTWKCSLWLTGSPTSSAMRRSLRQRKHPRLRTTQRAQKSVQQLEHGQGPGGGRGARLHCEHGCVRPVQPRGAVRPPGREAPAVCRLRPRHAACRDSGPAQSGPGELSEVRALRRREELVDGEDQRGRAQHGSVRRRRSCQCIRQHNRRRGGAASIRLGLGTGLGLGIGVDTSSSSARVGSRQACHPGASSRPAPRTWRAALASGRRVQCSLSAPPEA
eukprot:SAG22_NODE_6188_length_888_cov_1.281369_2_plen_217_part_01